MKRLAVLTALTSCALALAGPAFGHAAYESSDPPDEGTVSSPPSAVTANFTEPLAEGDSYMDVTDPCGRDVGGETSITADSMTVSMAGAAQGEYVVRWRARSSVDNHVTTGDFSFTATRGEPCPGEEEESQETSKERDGSGDATRNEGGGDFTAQDEASDGADGGGSNGSGGANSNARSREGRGRDRSEPEQPTSDAALAAAEDRPRSRSALDGIPIGGLVLTLALSALIGAAAGKIYFSLGRETD